jgi:hypothetical protein
MKCEECQTLIEDYVDGVLNENAGALVSSHIGACSQCAGFREELIREQAIYARYERDVEVTPMLWSSIETQIKQEQAARPTGLILRLREQILGMFAAPRLSPALTFALVLIAIAVTVIVMTRLNSRGREQVAITNSNTSVQEPDASNGNRNSVPKPPPEPSNKLATAGGANSESAKPVRVRATNPRTTAVSSTLTPAQLVREAEQKYLTAIAMLSRDVNGKRSQLDPIMLARFDSALGDIDRTIRDTRRVVRENPEDPIALQYLLAAYSKKVDVLRGMSASTD